MIAATSVARHADIAQARLDGAEIAVVLETNAGIGGKPGASALPSPKSTALVQRPERIHSTTLSG